MIDLPGRFRGYAPLLGCALLACGSRTGLDAPERSAPSRPSMCVPHEQTGGYEGKGCGDELLPWLLFEVAGVTVGPNGALYAVRSDGTDGHVVSLANPTQLYASISVDGTELFYVISAAGSDAIPGNGAGSIVMEDFAHGTARTVVSGEDLTYSALSPDGQTLAYTVGDDIHLVGVDGTDDRLLVASMGGVGCGHPAFTFDSQTVVYACDDAFFSILVDGSAAQALVTEAGGNIHFPNPALSPCSTSVAAVVTCDGEDFGLRVYSFASLPAACSTGSLLAATSGTSASPVPALNPAWGPTGLIAYGSDVDIYVVDPSGGSPRNMSAALNAGGNSSFDPIWAPGCAPIP